ncbi:MAG: globin family protein [Pseudomonadota bacterium]
MKQADIDKIQASFSAVAPISDAAAEIFYARLFEIAPEVKPLFTGDMAEQGKKLMMTLGVVVGGLKDLDALLPVAADLAKRHVGYGVLPEHYPLVGEALIFTLGKGLGEAFTPDVETAWVGAYGTLSGAMIDAAYGSTEAAP